ncbi:phosphodiesterase, putative [Eimeria necatrix]|uniref:Phosphodiesterase n=1 Tax=Eimeria necatrix TaxID=51315 RepID=U6N0P8_9EIME|nr:phosphodiesterase, putative [Eimeria necatrix]CDJ68888.1 phosphodiesterase, putative [Eimeria necatrix]
MGSIPDQNGGSAGANTATSQALIANNDSDESDRLNLSRGVSKPAELFCGEENRSLTPAQSVRKTVSFKPALATEFEGANGGPTSMISSVRSDSLFQTGEEIRRTFTKADRSVTGNLGQSFRQLSGCTEEEEDEESSAFVPIVQDLKPTELQKAGDSKESKDPEAEAAPASTPSPPLHKSISSRILSALSAPFRELAGGELNFTWAYKEATALHRSRLSKDASGKSSKSSSPSRPSTDHWSTRLSDGHRAASRDLQYFPLQFVDKEAEAEYVAVTNYQCSLRMSIYLLLQHCLLLPIQFTIFLSDPESNMWSILARWFLHPLLFAFVIVTLFGLSLALALLYPNIIPCGGGYFCRIYAAQVACAYSFAFSGCMSASLIVGQVYMSKTFREQPEETMSQLSLGVILMNLCSLNTEISILYVYSFASTLLFMDLIGPILTKWTVVLHFLTSVGLTAPFIVGYVDGKLFSLCTLLSVAAISTILTAMAYAGRLSGELQHRLLFHQWRRSRLRLIELLNEGGERVKNRTAMENVVGELEQCGKILQHMRNVDHDFGEEFTEVFRIISDCRRKLLAGENLYTVDFGHADRFSKPFLQLFSQYGTEPVENARSMSHQRSLTAFQSMAARKSADMLAQADLRFSCDIRHSSQSDSDEEPVKKQATLQRKKLLEASERNAPAIGQQWAFSVLEVEKEVQGSLYVIGVALLGPFVTDWGCSSDELCDFLCTLQSQYQKNPYHNHAHAAMVGHATVCMANMLGVWPLMEPLEKAALAVAALAHDVGHPGRTNQFFVACFDPLELRRGLPISPLCSRSANMDIARSQESFLSFVARPLVAELVELDGHKRVAAEVLSLLEANMSRWRTMAAEGAPVKLPATDKHTQSRTFTLHAVRSLAGPALSLSQSKTAIISGEKRYGEKREEKVPLRSTSRIVHDDTLPTSLLFDWMAVSEEATCQWSPRFTVDSVNQDVANPAKQGEDGNAAAGSS